MSMDALGYTLGLLTLGMTMVAVRKGNMLFSMATAALWAAFLNFILANTTAGTTWQEMFVVSALVMIICVPLLSFLSRRRATRMEAEGYYTSENGALVEDKRPRESKSAGLMDMDTDEYREYIRGRLRKHRRRR